MKPSNIIPGRKYKHSGFPNIEYLGISIAKKKVYGSNFQYENNLVLLSGLVVLRPGQIGKGGNKFWSKFSLAD